RIIVVRHRGGQGNQMRVKIGHFVEVAGSTLFDAPLLRECHVAGDAINYQREYDGLNTLDGDDAVDLPGPVRDQLDLLPTDGIEQIGSVVIDCQRIGQELYAGRRIDCERRRELVLLGG